MYQLRHLLDILLLLHGVTQSRTITATAVVKNGTITISSMFNIKLVDHKIQVPTLVFQKIAEVIEVSLEAVLVKI